MPVMTGMHANAAPGVDQHRDSSVFSEIAAQRYKTRAAPLSMTRLAAERSNISIKPSRSTLADPRRSSSPRSVIRSTGQARRLRNARVDRIGIDEAQRQSVIAGGYRSNIAQQRCGEGFHYAPFPCMTKSVYWRHKPQLLFKPNSSRGSERIMSISFNLCSPAYPMTCFSVALCSLWPLVMRPTLLGFSGSSDASGAGSLSFSDQLRRIGDS